MQSFNEFVITIDTDWVPDFIIESVAEKLISHKVCATWFITHDSPAIAKLRNIDFFELGIHPNFLPNSSHGNTINEVLTHMLEIVPNAISSRSHAVVQSGHILQSIALETPIKIDSTLFLPDMPDIKPLTQYFGERKLLRMPFVWADDHALNRPDKSWDIDRYVNLRGLKVMLFHPLQIYINQQSSNDYQLLKKSVKNLTELSEDQVKQFIYSGEGVGSFFDALLSYLSDKPTKCLKDFL